MKKTIPWLQLDVKSEIDRITSEIRRNIHQVLRKQGAVLGISGGIDSSVALALTVRALGAERVVGLKLPEKESKPVSSLLADSLALKFGVSTITEDISPALEGLGCYKRRDEAIQRVFPQYQPGWNVRIILPGSLLDGQTLSIFHLEIEDPVTGKLSQRLPLREYQQIVAASNFKQRVRTNFLYYHAEKRNYAVIGTPNRNEHDLGFFVRGGDGLYDFAPIRHLYKTQVYMLAEALEIPREIQERKPTTDTYPGGGSQEDFFYRLPFDILDGVQAGLHRGLSKEEIASTLGLSAEQVENIARDYKSRRRGTAYLRQNPAGLEE